MIESSGNHAKWKKSIYCLSLFVQYFYVENFKNERQITKNSFLESVVTRSKRWKFERDEERKGN